QADALIPTHQYCRLNIIASASTLLRAILVGHSCSIFRDRITFSKSCVPAYRPFGDRAAKPGMATGLTGANIETNFEYQKNFIDKR
ncbi:MAG: hypothetical protein K2F92_03760, partial [Alistipes sp.]|nr:hypothetical protein [Alistipes sp.]